MKFTTFNPTYFLYICTPLEESDFSKYKEKLEECICEQRNKQSCGIKHSLINTVGYYFRNDPLGIFQVISLDLRTLLIEVVPKNLYKSEAPVYVS